MAGASIETTLALWASSLHEVKRLMRPLFKHDRVSRLAEHFLDGLLGEERRKLVGCGGSSGRSGSVATTGILGRRNASFWIA